ncbi:exodeoxyribonuclease VII large subunit [Inmirania thermothiophila]|uniref:Exodeoxyribonuclease 7 large subunit n=1 Tax=Inmirania thermothiophila TaxID=1750597 RepID=A0A3N1Y814_9GAMM|nr:exodeoxyribonuclease VII large subunit [Inmirania thermothiophila]ROR34890.1 exodeoxyribonuclease VII large subunit [Inmirania thermothiophila]
MTADAGREIYTVSRLNREARALLEEGFPLLWVEGEVSNLARPRSGHLYFTLKDASAQVRCAFFRNRHRPGMPALADGMQVLVRARVSLYEARGDYQLLVESVEEAGDGALRRAFEALKARLAAEGLFDADRKRPLPRLPRAVAVVTSPTGAAIRDILHVLARRFPAVPVYVYPTAVQGEGAAAQIVAAIRRAGRERRADVLILARGGGSLEDLWPFNEEAVARAIRACPIPVVSGVGHEVDVTIADLAADLRAPTPSAAAELVVPDRGEWRARLARDRERLAQAARRLLRRRREGLEGLAARLARQHPRRILRQRNQRLDEASLRLERAARALVGARRRRLELLAARLARQHPRRRLAARRARLAELRVRLGTAARGGIERRRRHLAALRAALGAGGRRPLERWRPRLARLAGRLDGTSPLRTLARGYAIVITPDGRILRDAAAVRAGDAVRARLARGALDCRVEAVHRGETP